MESNLLEEIKDFELTIKSGIHAINRRNRLRELEINLNAEISEIEKQSFADDWLEVLKSHKETIVKVIENIDETMSGELEDLSKLIMFDCVSLSEKLLKMKSK